MGEVTLQGFGFRVEGSGSRVLGLGFWVLGLGVEIWGVHGYPDQKKTPPPRTLP